MKYALIDPNAPVNVISSWKYDEKTKTYTPVITEVPNSDRVAEVVSRNFEVAPPLFWIYCDNNVVADEWYFNNVTQNVELVPPPAPYPNDPVEGTETI